MNSKLKRLIRRIKPIDTGAAEYIQKEVLPRYQENGNKPPHELYDLFIWELTPQGKDFWRNIYIKLQAEI